MAGHDLLPPPPVYDPSNSPWRWTAASNGSNGLNGLDSSYPPVVLGPVGGATPNTANPAGAGPVTDVHGGVQPPLEQVPSDAALDVSFAPPGYGTAVVR